MPLGMDVCLGPGDFVVDGDPAPPSPRRGRSPPNFRYMFIVANGWIDHDDTWHGCRPQPRRLCVRWGLGTQLPLPKKEAEPPPQFSAHVYCGQTAGWIKMALGMEAGLGPGNIVLDGGTQLPSPERRHSPPNFRPFLLWPNGWSGCIKMSIGMEVDLSPGDFVLDGDPASYPKRGRAPPIFGPRLLSPNGCMDQDATWYGGRPPPTWHCVRWGSRSPSPKGAHLHPIFGPCLRRQTAS